MALHSIGLASIIVVLCVLCAPVRHGVTRPLVFQPTPAISRTLPFRKQMSAREWDEMIGVLSITLYEGLPHQFYEFELLRSEASRTPTLQMNGYPFYRETLSLTASDKSQLMSILVDGNTSTKYSGEKKCGGFHPDFAVRLSVQELQVFFQICFGCGEMKVFGDKERIYDLTDNGTARLKKLLTPYRKNRPHADDPSR